MNALIGFALLVIPAALLVLAIYATRQKYPDLVQRADNKTRLRDYQSRIDRESEDYYARVVRGTEVKQQMLQRREESLP